MPKLLKQVLKKKERERLKAKWERKQQIKEIEEIIQ